jgi:membrane glycosyltransferase
MGIMSYVASPLWLMLLVVSAIDMILYVPPEAASYIGLEPSLAHSVSYAAQLVVLVLATLALLYVPKFLAVIAVLEDPARTRAHGGTGGLLKGLFWESLYSTLMAPIVMLQHSWYVLSILMGMATGWNAQTRSDRALPWDLVIRKFWPHTLVGLVATIILWRYAGGGFNWFVPLLAGMLLSIPLVVFSSSPLMGLWARKDGIFVVPSETRGLPVLDRAHALAGAHQELPRDARQLVLEDRAVRDLHLALLSGTPQPDQDARLGVLRAQAAQRETAGFSREDWTLLLSDSEGLRSLP